MQEAVAMEPVNREDTTLGPGYLDWVMSILYLRGKCKNHEHAEISNNECEPGISDDI